MNRYAVVLALAIYLLMPTSLAAAECQFVLGFKTLRDLIGHEIVGECLENEHHPDNGDGLQQTTGGLLVWRKADNWTAFTDGYRTWINGPNGLVQRLNTERFEWEADYAPGGGIATPTPTPTAIATPIPSITPSPTATPALMPAQSLTELAMASAWYRDGLDYSDIYNAEPGALRALERIDRNNPQLAKVMSKWAWIFDEDLHPDESGVIQYIARLDETVPEFVSYIVDLPWIHDGIDNIWESLAASDLYGAALRDLNFAIELATTPWVVDGITYLEGLGIAALSNMSGRTQYATPGPQVARRIMNFVNSPPEELDLYLVSALNTIPWFTPDGFERLLAEPWFVDGLDVEERIYLIAAAGSELDADQLFEPHSIASAAVVLPHTGVVNLWVVHRLPSHTVRTVLANLEKAVRASEQLWELPFPVDHVILSLMVDPGTRGQHLGQMMLLPPDNAGPVTLYHEVAHYYFNTGPGWFSEGGAEFTERLLTNGGNFPTIEFPANCLQHGFDDLQALNDDVNGPGWDGCRYSMGLHFLVALRETMGEEAWLSALRAFYLEYGYIGLYVRQWEDWPDDEVVYRAFMEHAPPSLRTKVRDVFRRLHGGPFVE